MGTATVGEYRAPPLVVTVALALISMVTALTLAKGRIGVLQVTINRAPTGSDRHHPPEQCDLRGDGAAERHGRRRATDASFPSRLRPKPGDHYSLFQLAPAPPAQGRHGSREVDRSRCAHRPDGFCRGIDAFTATALFTDGSGQPLVNDITWSSDQSVGRLHRQHRLATALTVGTTTIGATVTTSVGPVTGETIAHGATRAPAFGGDATHDVVDGRPGKACLRSGPPLAPPALTVTLALSAKALRSSAPSRS